MPSSASRVPSESLPDLQDRAGLWRTLSVGMSGGGRACPGTARRPFTGRRTSLHWDGAVVGGCDGGTGTTLSDPLPAQPPPPGAAAQWSAAPAVATPPVLGRRAVNRRCPGRWRHHRRRGRRRPGDAPTHGHGAGWRRSGPGWAMRFWETDHGSVIVSNGRTQNAGPDPAWLPPQGPPGDGTSPQASSARRAGWHLGRWGSPQPQGRIAASRWPGHAVTEVARPARPSTTSSTRPPRSYPPCLWRSAAVVTPQGCTQTRRAGTSSYWGWPPVDRPGGGRRRRVERSLGVAA